MKSYEYKYRGNVEKEKRKTSEEQKLSNNTQNNQEI
jgi:hypothetical protein